MGRGRKESNKKKEGGRKKREDDEDEVVVVSGDEDEVVSDNEEVIVTKKRGSSSKDQVEDDEVEKKKPPSAATKSIRKVFIVGQDMLSGGWENIEQITLQNPKTRRPSVFLVDARNSADLAEEERDKPFLFEVLTMEEETRSFFIGENVISDGNVYTCTVVDPLFTVLPIMRQSNKAMQLEDHLREHFEDARILKLLCYRLLASNQLKNIAKKIVCDDIIAFKFMDDKMFEWLTSKAQSISKMLTARGITSSEASISSNFTKSLQPTEKDKEQYWRYACEITGEYLPEDARSKWFEKLGLPLVEKKMKRKSELDLFDCDDPKKLKTDITIVPTEDYGSSTGSQTTANNSGAKLTAKNKELIKAAKGTQSLFKFFTPKTK